jgi:SAM-dependent methyltransferase
MNTPELVVIEVGCGTGQNLSQFGNLAHKERKAPRLVGIDYSSSHRDLVSNVYGIDEVYASTDELPPSLLGDVLILSHVLEHFSDLDHGLSRIANMIKDGGILYVEAPGVLNLADNLVHKLNFKQYSCMPHTYCYNLKTLAYVLSHFGFKLIDGDEFIRAVFRRDSRTTPLSPPENVPRAVLETMELLKLPHYDLTSKALKADEDGDYELGKNLAGKALEMTPEFPYAQAALATIHAHAGNHEEAVHYARRALGRALPSLRPSCSFLDANWRASAAYTRPKKFTSSTWNSTRGICGLKLDWPASPTCREIMPRPCDGLDPLENGGFTSRMPSLRKDAP